MDKRIEKARIAIKEAFLELHGIKPLEKISIKELCHMANINKSTFYSHYGNIYALADAIEYETVLAIVSSIPKDLDYNLTNPELFTREVTIAFAKHLPEVKAVFSGKSKTHLETAIKKKIYEKYPEYEKDTQKNILLSYCIHGAYNASLSNPNADPATILQVLDNILMALNPCHCGEGEARRGDPSF